MKVQLEPLLVCLGAWLCMCLHADNNQLSIEDSIGQLFVIHLQVVDALNSEIETSLSLIRPGGVIYYEWANNLSHPKQVRALSARLQKAAELANMPALWICVDQEGGRVCRLRKGGYTHFPSAFALALADDTALTRAIGVAIGRELAYSGVNFNFAPVVDVWSNSDVTVIGNRCFGSRPVQVVQHAGAWLRGLQSTGVMGCIKHFPGHGEVAVDTHYEKARIDVSIEHLNNIELIPYRELANITQGVMSAHVLVPALDKERIATKSPLIIHHLLKERLKFQGIVFTDSLVMKAATLNKEDLAQSCIDALMAGCDVLVLGGRALVGAQAKELTTTDILQLKELLIHRAQVDSAFRLRVQEAAQKILRHKQNQQTRQVSSWNRQMHEQLARRVAERVVKWRYGNYYLQKTDTRVVMACSPVSALELKSWLGQWKVDWDVNNWQEAMGKIESYQTPGVLVLASYEAWNDPDQRALIQKAIANGWKVILLALGTTRDIDVMGDLTSIQVCSFDPYSLERAIKLLTSESR